MIRPGRRRDRRSVRLAALAAVLACAAVCPGMGLALPFLAVPALVGAGACAARPAIFAVYALAVMLAGLGLVGSRGDDGMVWLIWLLLVVIVSDVAGLFRRPHDRRAEVLAARQPEEDLVGHRRRLDRRRCRSALVFWPVTDSGAGPAVAVCRLCLCRADGRHRAKAGSSGGSGSRIART